MSDNSKSVFQVGSESLGKILRPRKHSQSANDALEDRLRFMNDFNAALSRIRILLGEKQSENLALLAEEARYSDPVSCEASREAEEKLLNLIEHIEAEANSGRCSDKTIGNARECLAIRNKYCQQGK